MNLNYMRTHKMNKEPLRDVFEYLCENLKGFNMIGEEFDFEYKNYTFTFLYRNNQIKLANDVDVYDERDNFMGTYSLKQANNIKGVNHE